MPKQPVLSWVGVLVPLLLPRRSLVCAAPWLPGLLQGPLDEAIRPSKRTLLGFAATRAELGGISFSAFYLAYSKIVESQPYVTRKLYKV